MSQRGRPRTFDSDAALRRAMLVFWEKGYEATSMADLTAAMQIGAPSLYAAFGNKADLFAAALKTYKAEIGLEIWNALSKAVTARQAFADFLQQTALAYAQPDTPRGCMIALGVLNGDTDAVSTCELLRHCRLENATLLRARLEEGVRDGEIAPTADCQKIADFYATVQHGMSITARDGATLASLQSTADAAMAAWDALTAPR
ncbi:TetR family transcriptional regulator [Rhizobium sp. Root73]|uniref:TetR/AcrR family transcriptional regulator n=1 Tax=unclassified Rhizobium TaxID=2613769 RepID=UPI000714C240|nr:MULTISPECIES: TetR/AcrR family transcriptional regulator [unclassified Rhizobium]KQV34179.1 TetR family transcriptional regulator [Rhizobium sp. Root1204]KQY17523.1 TetR family transcriptional regulator [Rhizobium sp. Root1334]KRC13403.1 TetR family transcriptional regulator [Rhizobium sp. Root73]